MTTDNLESLEQAVTDAIHAWLNEAAHIRLEGEVRVGASERFLDEDGDLQYRTLRDLTESETAELNCELSECAQRHMALINASFTPAELNEVARLKQARDAVSGTA
jgi:hypothetical protein